MLNMRKQKSMAKRLSRAFSAATLVKPKSSFTPQVHTGTKLNVISKKQEILMKRWLKCLTETKFILRRIFPNNSRFTGNLEVRQRRINRSPVAAQVAIN